MNPRPSLVPSGRGVVLLGPCFSAALLFAPAVFAAETPASGAATTFVSCDHNRALRDTAIGPGFQSAILNVGFSGRPENEFPCFWLSQTYELHLATCERPPTNYATCYQNFYAAARSNPISNAQGVWIGTLAGLSPGELAIIAHGISDHTTTSGDPTRTSSSGSSDPGRPGGGPPGGDGGKNPPPTPGPGGGGGGGGGSPLDPDPDDEDPRKVNPVTRWVCDVRGEWALENGEYVLRITTSLCGLAGLHVVYQNTSGQEFSNRSIEMTTADGKVLNENIASGPYLFPTPPGPYILKLPGVAGSAQTVTLSANQVTHVTFTGAR